MWLKPKEIPAKVSFHRAWWYKNYGIDFDEKYYFNSEHRMRINRKMERLLYERFEDLGLGNPNPPLVPRISGIDCTTVLAVLGCKLVFPKGEHVWFLPLNASDEKIRDLKVPDIEHVYPMPQIIEQANYLKEKYGRVKGSIGWEGTQNVALGIRGNQLFMDYYEKPSIVQKILQISTDTIIQVVKYADKLFGKPSMYVTGNCTVQMVSPQIYEDYLLTYDNLLSDKLTDSEHSFGIHYCGKNMEQFLLSLKKIKNLKFLEVGWGSDVAKTRKVFPNVTISARISPVRLGRNSKEEVEKDTRKLMEDGASYVCCVGIGPETPDENIRTMYRIAREYAELVGEHPILVWE